MGGSSPRTMPSKHCVENVRTRSVSRWAWRDEAAPLQASAFVKAVAHSPYLVESSHSETSTAEPASGDLRRGREMHSQQGLERRRFFPRRPPFIPALCGAA